MNRDDKLQKAVALAIAAGYQLDKDSFEFLTILALNEDPSNVITRAIQKLEDLTERPFLIEKTFLEQLLKPLETSKEIVREERPTIPESHSEDSFLSGTIPLFRPLAKEIEADLKILEDPGSKITSSGTLEDYLKYFQNRFKQLEKILRQRIDVKSATSILDAIRAQPHTKLKIIGMITEKRESKQRTLLTIEDLKASATVLVPRSAPQTLHQRARMLLTDQVICLCVMKTRSNLLIAEDIILPEIAMRKGHRTSVPIYAVLTSDMHVGSKQFTKEAFHRFVLWLSGKYGDRKMREIAGRVKYVMIAGDIVDGIGIYPNQAKELAIKDVDKQYKVASRYIEQIPDYIEVIVTPGNHDSPRKALPQPPISNAFLEDLQESRKVHSQGNPCTLSLHSVEVLTYHGRSLDDIVTNVPNMSHKHPEKAMQLLLQGRHLAPLYGGKTPISAEDSDSLVIERVPDIFHAGHVHALEFGNYRGVIVVNSGCWQNQTEYMRRNGFTPTFGKVPVIDLQTLEIDVLSFN